MRAIGETPEGVVAAIEAMRPLLGAGPRSHRLQNAMPAGAARNALDCAFWDLEAKRSGRRAYRTRRLAAPKPLITAYTISLGPPAAMAEAAARAADRPLLKVKLGSGDDRERIAAVRRAAPHAELIVDANEGWTDDNLVQNLAACAQAGVTLIEQPLPEGRDEALARIKRPIPVCADESVHDRASLAALAGKYDAVNVKLDKTGGLTEALALAAEAEQRRLCDHGRLHGGDVARHGAGDAGGATGERRRSRRTAASGQGPAGWTALRRQSRLSIRGALWG